VDLEDPDVQTVAPVEGEVRFQRTNQGILVSGAADTTVRLQCVRCLEPFDQPVHVDFAEMFLPTIEVLSGRPLPTVTEEQGFAIDAHHQLDLTEMLRQHIILNLPDQPICRPACAGLCPVCGGNRNITPCTCETESDNQWSALAHLSLEDLPSEN
jgi:uncharacterized protein